MYEPLLFFPFSRDVMIVESCCATIKNKIKIKAQAKPLLLHKAVQIIFYHMTV